MCGRYSLTSPEEALRRLFGYDGPPPNFPARYNVAPTQEMPVIKAGADGKRGLLTMRWGLIPSWAKDPKLAYKMINARAETVAEKPSYRSAFKARRCLVPADGFFEWKKEAEAKQPYWIHMPDRGPFAFAGLWETWKDPAAAENERPVRSFTIVTTTAAPSIEAIHARMPVILPPEAYDAWLNTDGVTGEDALGLLKPYGGDIVADPVSTRVNNVKNDDAGVLAGGA